MGAIFNTGNAPPAARSSATLFPRMRRSATSTPNATISSGSVSTGSSSASRRGTGSGGLDDCCGYGAREQSIALLLVEELCRVARRVKGTRAVSLSHDRDTVSMCKLEKNAVAQPNP